MLQALRNIWRLPDLRRRQLELLGILVFIQLMIVIPVAGFSLDLAPLFHDNPFLALFDIFTGGAASHFSIFSLGIYPYVVAHVLAQLGLARLAGWEPREPGASEKYMQFVYRCTPCVAFVMGYAYLYLLSRLGVNLAIDLWQSLYIVALFCASTMLFIWLADEIEQPHLLIAGTMLAAVPGYFFDGATSDVESVFRFLVAAGVVIVYIAIIQAVRRIPVQYGKRTRTRRLYGGSSTTIPIAYRGAGLRPFYYLFALLGIMQIASGWLQFSQSRWINALAGFQQQITDADSPTFWLLFFLLAVPLKIYFDVAHDDAQNLANNLSRNGGFIPGIRPGKRTAEYLSRIILRLAVPSAVLTVGLIVVPAMIFCSLSGSGIYAMMLMPLMYVGEPIIDYLRQMEAQLIMRNYEGFKR